MSEELLIDGQNLAMRALHALPPLTDRDGQRTAEVYGLLRQLGALRKRYPTAKMTVVWDGSCERRASIFPEYKAGRGTYRPVDLKGSGWHLSSAPFSGRAGAGCIAAAMHLLPLLGVHQAQDLGAEADDVILTKVVSGRWDASYVRAEKIVVSTDRDLLQLVQFGVQLLVPAARTMASVSKAGVALAASSERLMTEDLLRRTYGVAPDQILSLRALAGDESDNLPGVPQLGLRRAAKFVRDFGSVDGIYEAIRKGVRLRKNKEGKAQMAAKQYLRFVESEDLVRRNLGLMTLRIAKNIHEFAPTPDKASADIELRALDINPKPIFDAFFPRQQSFA